MKRIYLLLMLILFISGCDATYELTISPQLTFDEKIIINQTNASFDPSIITAKEYFESQINLYKNIDLYKGHKIKSDYQENETNIIITNEFEKIENYEASKAFKSSLYDRLTITNEYNVLTIEGNQLTTLLQNDSDYGQDYELVETVKVVIRSKLPLISTNADVSNPEKGEYIWNYPTGTSDKNLQIKLDSTRNYLLIAQFYIEKYWYFSIIVVVLSLVGFIFYIRIKKVNRL